MEEIIGERFYEEMLLVCSELNIFKISLVFDSGIVFLKKEIHLFSKV